MPRFVLLEHVGHPDDPAGRHYDLLLEDGDACRTWRLASIPAADGEPVSATPLPPHRLAWLDVESANVSGGRGVAQRIDGGTYEVTDGAEPGSLDIMVSGTLLSGRIMGVPPESKNP
jgi:hypothetical protein